MKKAIDIINENGVLVVTSEEIVINFDKSRKNVIRDIENLIDKLGGAEKCLRLFIQSRVQNDQNKQWYKEYLITRDGLSLLVMGFTGIRALEWKLKYIEAFNKMEQALKEPYSELSKELRAIFALDKKTNEIENRITEVEETAYILPFQKKALTKARNRKVLSICGGKESIAYKDKSFRGRVYSDLARNIKEIYDVNEYDAIPRNKFSEAIEIVKNYNIPIHLQYEKEKKVGGIDV